MFGRLTTKRSGQSDVTDPSIDETSYDVLAQAMWLLPDPMFVFDRNSNLIAVNQSAGHSFPAATTLGMPLTDVLANIAVTSQNPTSLAEVLVATVISSNGAAFVASAAGRRWEIRCQKSADVKVLSMRDSGMAGMVALEADEERLLDEGRAQFLSTMSHELRTPLNTIAGFAEIIAMRAFGEAATDRYRDYAADIASEARRMIEAVDALFTLSALESDGVDIRLETIDAGIAIQKAASVLSASHPETTISFTPPETPILFKADPELLHQAITGVLSESLRTAGANGTVKATLQQRDNGTLAIKFTARGEGSPESTSSKRSAGPGLWVGWTIAEAHGGSVRYGAGQEGSREIRIILPLDPCHPA